MLQGGCASVQKLWQCRTFRFNLPAWFPHTVQVNNLRLPETMPRSPEKLLIRNKVGYKENKWKRVMRGHIRKRFVYFFPFRRVCPTQSASALMAIKMYNGEAINWVNWKLIPECLTRPTIKSLPGSWKLIKAAGVDYGSVAQCALRSKHILWSAQPDWNGGVLEHRPVLLYLGGGGFWGPHSTPPFILESTSQFLLLFRADCCYHRLLP